MTTLYFVFHHEDDDICNQEAGLKVKVSKYQDIRQNHLVVGSCSAVDTILRWMRYGMAINKQESKPGDFLWREGRTILEYQGKPLQISDLATLGTTVVSRAKDLLIQKLCFNWNPMETKEFETLKDIEVSIATGYSFLMEPANTKNLVHTPEKLLTMALSSTTPPWKVSGRYNLPAIRIWTKDHDRFLEYLLVLVYLLSGQPPRGEELITTRYQNTATLKRNIFISGQDMILALTYHKGQSQSGFSKYIARFFPQVLKRLMLGYLYFVRPFAVWCQSTLSEEVTAQSPLIWSSNREGTKPWDADRLSKALNRLSEEIIGYQLGLQNYRQISIKIDQDILRTPSDICLSGHHQDNSDGEDDIHDLQAGHTSHVAQRHYGVDIDGIKEVDRGLWSRYREVSMKWHRFMGVAGIDQVAKVGDN